MKKILTLMMTLTLIVSLFSVCASAEATTVAPAPQVIELSAGTMRVYDFGDLKLHAYETNDPIADENFLLETADELIVIELIGFYDNIQALEEYVQTIGKPINSVIVSYHPAGGDQYQDVQMYATEGLGEVALVAGFVEAFGEAFNGSLPTAFDLVQPGTMTIGGVTFNVIQTADAFDLEIPAIDVYLTHMVGSNTHNILVSVDQIDATIAQMKDFQAKNYSLILTSHDIPRTIEVAAEKIDYLEKTKEIVVSSENAEAFLQAMKAAFPEYLGENYLEISAGALFAA